MYFNGTFGQGMTGGEASFQEGAPVPVSGARAAVEAGNYHRAARLAAAMTGENAPEGKAVLKAVGIDPVAIWSGIVLAAIIALYWAVVR